VLECSITRNKVAPALVLVLVAGVSGCTDSGAPNNEPAPAKSASEVSADHVIYMTEDMSFEPSELVIHAGESVAWINEDQVPHTSTIRANDPPLETLPRDADTWDSGLLETDEAFEITLTVPGEYGYVCTLHLGQNMTGRITVKGREDH